MIALLVDLPDAHRTGLITAGGRFAVGRATPGLGFYLETLGAALLLIVSGLGLLAGSRRAPARAVRLLTFFKQGAQTPVLKLRFRSARVVSLQPPVPCSGRPSQFVPPPCLVRPSYFSL